MSRKRRKRPKRGREEDDSTVDLPAKREGPPEAKSASDSNTPRGAEIHVQRTEEVASFQGPIPPPEHLHAYEQTLPGAAERIMAMAERQASHRQDLEKRVVSANLRSENRGQISGTLLGALSILGSVVIAVWGNPFAGAGATILVTATFALIYRSSIKAAKNK